MFRADSSAPQNKWNAVCNVIGEGLWGFLSAMIASGTVLTIVLRDLGAKERMIGSIMSVETVMFAGIQLIGVYLFRTNPRLKIQLVAYHFYAIIPFLFVICGSLLFANILPEAVVRWMVFGGYVCFIGAIGIIIAVWMEWMANLFAVTVRGTVMGIAFGASAFCGAAGTVVSAKIIQVFPGTNGYALIYGMAGIIASLSLFTFLFVRQPERNSAEQGVAVTLRDIGRLSRQSFSDRNFIFFLVGRFLMSAGFAVIPFIALFYMSLRGGGFSKSVLIVYSAALTVGAGIANILLGRMGDHFGHRLGLIIGAFAQVTALVIVIWFRGPVACVLVYLFTGVALSSGFVSHYNMLYETSPYPLLKAHIAAGNIAFSLSTFALPFIAGLIAERRGYLLLFNISLYVSCAALVWLFLFVKEPRLKNQQQPFLDAKIRS